MKKVNIEVIAYNLEDAIRINNSNADRIELLANINEGGTTPSIELVKEIMDEINIPLRVMVRDNSNSFIYDEETMNKHYDFIKQMNELGVEGIVFSSLEKEGVLNEEHIKKINELKGNLNISYSRAFDTLTPDQARMQYCKLVANNIDTILTSGCASNAMEGSSLLRELIERNDINILIGGGVNLDNAKELIELTNGNYLHLGSAVREDGTNNSSISIDKINKLNLLLNN